MAAPTLQAQGADNAVTTGDVTPVIPAHVADDILVCIVSYHAVNQVGIAADIPTPAGWTKAGFDIVWPGTGDDGRAAAFWRRATASGTTVTFARDTGWDTGTDTSFYARAFVIRGCITTGDPFDEYETAGPYTTSNQNFAALTVSGSERLAIHFGLRTNAAGTPFGAAPAGWTAGTADSNTTGSDHASQTYRQDNVSANTSAAAPTVSWSGSGGYAYLGFSFKPPSSGSALTNNPADTLSLSDSITVELGRAANPADSVTMSDATALERRILREDSVSPTDQVALGREIVAPETLGVSDNATAELGKQVQADDSVSMSDSTTLGRGIGVGDAVSLAEALIFQREVLFGDTLGLSDGVTTSRGVQIGPSDTVTPSDNVTTESGKGANVDDTVSISDSAVLTLDRAIFLDDTLNLADSVAFVREIAVSDPLALADAISKQFGLSLADTAAISDLVEPELLGGEAWEVFPADSVTVADALSFMRELVLTEQISVSDANQRFLNGILIDGGVAIVRQGVIWIGRF